MTKYFCDVCGKEINIVSGSYANLNVPIMSGGDIYNSKNNVDMCRKCAKKYYELYRQFVSDSKNDEK